MFSSDLNHLRASDLKINPKIKIKIWVWLRPGSALLCVEDVWLGVIIILLCDVLNNYQITLATATSQMIPASAFIFYFIFLHEGFQNSKKNFVRN